MVSTVRGFLRQYPIALLLMGALAMIGLWPGLLAPLGRLYVIMCSWLHAGALVGHHLPPLLVGFIAPIILALAIAGVVAGIREAVAQRRLSTMLECRRPVFAHLDTQKARKLSGSRDVVVTNDPGIYAFCNGMFHPKIYLSRGILSVLDEDEIDALLCHERHHQRHRDPSWLFLTGLLGSLAPLLPVLGLIDRWVRVKIELAADRAALADHPPEVLGSAMLKILRLMPATKPGILGVGFSPGQARIAALLGKPVRVEVDWRDLVLSVLVLVECGAVVVWLAFQSLPNPPFCAACPAF